ncbi:MAG: DUF6504 family protein [Pseudomonadota bacterium]
MPNRRILCIWFPRMGVERLIRLERAAVELPLATVEELGNAHVIASVSVMAQGRGVHVGQPVRDAHAVCSELITRRRNIQAEAGFLTVLRRWAGKFSPWVSEQQPDGLAIDLTGCAHLFGGEEALLVQVHEDCEDLGLSVQCGIADTLGAAWALARYAGQPGQHHRSGDAIDQEARATRSRAAKRRRWERGGAAPVTLVKAGAEILRIAAPGKTHSALANLPIAALRLEPDQIAGLARLGLRRVGDLAGQPRAGLARRFGKGLVMRLDQAFGSAPEPISPARTPLHFAVRMTLPDPIGLEEDVLAGVDRLLPRLCERLREKGRGARKVRVQAFRSDHTMEWLDVILARASDDPARLRPLLAMRLDSIDAGFGIDMLRLEAVQTEPLHARTKVGHLDAARAVSDRLTRGTALDDLMGRLGGRIGMEAITRRHPVSSHIPEKTAQVLAAAWSEPARDWPGPPAPRPLLLWRPEPVNAPPAPHLPAEFRWRGRDLHISRARGPERIAPEWWLDEPDWRTGVRDYWRVQTQEHDLLWLYFAHGSAMSAGWFCQGSFA